MLDNESTGRLLVVDDDPDAQELIKRALVANSYEVVTAGCAEEALQLIRDFKPDLILLDIVMPRISGLKLLKEIRCDSRWENIPVILVSSLADTPSVVSGLNEGASDYVSKPISIPVLLARVRTHLKVGNLIRELERQRELLVRLATYDGLTSVLNRRSFGEVLDTEISRSRRHDHNLSLLLLDIDHFKRVNDTHGHLVGDAVLVEFCQRLSNCIRASDVLGRYGGEEFCILLPETHQPAAIALAERCREGIAREEFSAGGVLIPITTSVGVVSAAVNSEMTADSLIGFADRALYKAKENGRNQIDVFSAQ